MSANPGLRPLDALGRMVAQATHPVPTPDQWRQAAVRLLLRLVVIRCAELQRLLPVDNAIYRSHYSLGELLGSLRQLHGASPAALTVRFAGWPRLIALGRLLHRGSSHPALLLPAYGGGLFGPAEEDEGLAVALAELEGSRTVTDRETLELLELVAGLAGEAAPAAGDSSRIVGSLYEQLLDCRVSAADSGPLKLERDRQVRKAHGVYYTPPRLARAVVARALAPWGRDDGCRQRPEQLLALRICDPAMGSGAFLVAALEFLSRELLASLAAHDRLTPAPHGVQATLVTLGPDCRFQLPGRPGEPAFDSLLLAHLRRQVVEHCLYGVDRDPLAVELARLALWLETMDSRLPFTFLEHKLRVGDSLVGAWCDELSVYPLKAFSRAGADAGELATKRRRCREQLDRIQRERRFGVLPFLQPAVSTTDRQVLARLVRRVQRLPAELAERKREAWLDGYQRSPVQLELTATLDRWCALWFWPADLLYRAPEPIAEGEFEEASRRVATGLARELRFFHWEVAFPELFTGSAQGFDVIIGNPPWEAIKGAAGEGGDGRSAALANFFANRHQPGPAGRRPGRRRRPSPFSRQGQGDLNTYKLFLEQATRLVRPGGHLALLLPAGIYSDQGTAALRRLLVREWRWELLVSFDNRERFFPIDSRFRFALVVAGRGGRTRTVMLQEQSDFLAGAARGRRWLLPPKWAGEPLPEPSSGGPVPAPGGMAAPISSAVRFRREFDAGNPDGLFVPAAAWFARGLVPDRLGLLRPPGSDEAGPPTALPVYQGVMIDQYRFSAAAFVAGQGRRVRWMDQGERGGRPSPQFYMGFEEYRRSNRGVPGFKVAVRRVTNATNCRTLLAALIPGFPCSDKAAVLVPPSPDEGLLLVAGLNSLVVDSQLRRVLGGATLGRHHLRQLRLPPPPVGELRRLLLRCVLQLNCGHELFAPLWLAMMSGQDEALATRGWRQWWATEPELRRRLSAVVDGWAALAIGFSASELAELVGDCHHPAARLADRTFTARLPATGFWRQDRELEPPERRTVLALESYRLLAHEGPAGIERWLAAAQAPFEPSATSWEECRGVAAAVDAMHRWLQPGKPVRLL